MVPEILILKVDEPATGFRNKLLHIEFAESIIGIEEPAIFF